MYGQPRGDLPAAPPISNSNQYLFAYWCTDRTNSTKRAADHDRQRVTSAIPGSAVATTWAWMLGRLLAAAPSAAREIPRASGLKQISSAPSPASRFPAGSHCFPYGENRARAEIADRLPHVPRREHRHPGKLETPPRMRRQDAHRYRGARIGIPPVSTAMVDAGFIPSQFTDVEPLKARDDGTSRVAGGIDKDDLNASGTGNGDSRAIPAARVAAPPAKSEKPKGRRC